MDSRYAVIPGFIVSALLISFLASGFRPLPISSELINNQQTNLTSSNKSSQLKLHAQFPEKIQRWTSLITKAAAQYGLEADLIASVILMESGGDETAYSHSGAVGLMQVMPNDGLAASFLCNGKPCFANRPAMAALYDPEFNIDYGAQMLADLLKRTGSLREALHAYGPMDVGYSYADRVLAIFQSTL